MTMTMEKKGTWGISIIAITSNYAHSSSSSYSLGEVKGKTSAVKT